MAVLIKKSLSRNCQMQSVEVCWKNFLIVNAVSCLKIAKSFSKILEKKKKIFQPATLLKKLTFSLVFFEGFFYILGRHILKNFFTK